ncbi:hypothetical protein EZV62_026261 [Acer yangbiense]|uniref:Gnk2-homologous domain-containing protein n=1 Tax=Acer yangbiense TaxID=1000413 RepID=A0A5C7GR88_9ROSI|nr:hypothetical protein EZV62_026261 [Acer yangbiense]
MSSFQFFMIFVCLLSLSSSLFTFTSAADGTRDQFCSEESFSRNSTYQSNINLLLSSLQRYTESGYDKRFYRTTEGQDPNMVYGLFQCRGDVNTTICQDCVTLASTYITQNCPAKKEALVWYDECYLRYSNVTIFSIPVQNPRIVTYNLFNITVETNRFQKLVLSLLKEATTQAANDPKYFATRKGNFATSQTLYSLVQCAEDLSNNDCSNCLEEAISSLETIAIGASILFPSCNCRYELYPFYNENLTTSPPGKSRISSSIIIAIVAPITIAAVLFLAGYCFLTRRARKKYYTAQEEFVLKIAMNPNNKYLYNNTKYKHIRAENDETYHHGIINPQIKCYGGCSSVIETSFRDNGTASSLSCTDFVDPE